ncbi:hypothetical protein D1872_223470 [compost metagenome]
MVVPPQAKNVCPRLAGGRDFRAARLGVLQLFFAGYHRFDDGTGPFRAGYRGGRVLGPEVRFPDDLRLRARGRVPAFVFLYDCIWSARKHRICGDGLFALA